MAACGHMYLDGGDELEVGTAADNLLAFDAATSPGANGTQGQVSAGHAAVASDTCTEDSALDRLQLQVVGLCSIGGFCILLLLSLHTCRETWWRKHGLHQTATSSMHRNVLMHSMWQVRLSWPGKAGGNACTASTQWPALQGMQVLGVSGVDPATLTMQVPPSISNPALCCSCMHCACLHARPLACRKEYLMSIQAMPQSSQRSAASLHF